MNGNSHLNVLPGGVYTPTECGGQTNRSQVQISKQNDDSAVRGHLILSLPIRPLRRERIPLSRCPSHCPFSHSPAGVNLGSLFSHRCTCVDVNVCVCLGVACILRTTIHSFLTVGLFVCSVRPCWQCCHCHCQNPLTPSPFKVSPSFSVLLSSVLPVWKSMYRVSLCTPVDTD